MTDETTDELMEATYRALCKHGYASLRMQDIADESTKSKAALHYHYESKHDLLLAFLEYLYEQFETRITEQDDVDPPAALAAIIDHHLASRDESNHQEFRTAILEIKAQAPYDAAFREQLTAFDHLLSDHIQAILEDGIERGEFERELEPEAVAEFIVTVINGAQTRHVAVEYSTENTREMLLKYVQQHVFADVDPEVISE